MRRWVLIILLLVYPFQVALAMVDGCCVTTPAGVAHHSAGQEGGSLTVAPTFVADDGDSALADPHCPACVFGHVFYLPSNAIVMPAQRHQASAIAFAIPFQTSPQAVRPERPKWPAAAN
jgi:hypothetical protein